jgi:hypothetical protein
MKKISPSSSTAKYKNLNQKAPNGLILLLFKKVGSTSKFRKDFLKM